MRKNKKLWGALKIVILLVALALILPKCVGYVFYKEVREYDLTELESGTYVYYHRVVSSIPAQNYDLVTVKTNGRILTLDGDVIIRTSDSCRMVWTDINVVHADDIVLYVPNGSVEYFPVVQSR